MEPPATARPIAVVGGVQHLTARHPTAADALFTVVLAVVTLAGIVHGRPGPAAIVLHCLLWLPVVWRRRAPLAVFCVVALVALAQWLVDVRLTADVSLLVMLYTVAAHETRRRAQFAAAVLGVGVVMAAARWSPAGHFVPSLIFLTGMVAAAFFLGTSLRTRRAYIASVLDRAERLERERDQQAELAAAAERARIAREMHDIVAHSLSVIVTLADAALLTHRTAPDEAEVALRQVSTTGRAALGETRRLLGVLRATDAAAEADELRPQPGIDRLDELVAPLRTAGLRAELSIAGTPFTLPHTAQVTVFRIVQEALTNTLKHAEQLSSVRVSLRYDRPQLDVVVTDDGRAAPPVPLPGGHGLAGMRERAAAFAGTVTAGPRPGGGWRVAARLHVDGIGDDAV